MDTVLSGRGSESKTFRTIKDGQLPLPVLFVDSVLAVVATAVGLYISQCS